MKINDNQRVSLIVAAVIAFCMLLFPPFVVEGTTSVGAAYIRKSGYAFIFDLPYRATIDAITLIVQWLGVLIISGIAFFALGSSDD